MPKHVVQQGECLTSIAHRYGFGDPAKIWGHAQNKALADKRGNGHILFPGDELFIPPREAKAVGVARGKKVEVTVKLPRRHLELVIRTSKHEPIAGADWVLAFDGQELRGKTGPDGKLETEVPATTGKARLTVGKLVWELAIGHLDPILDAPDDGVSGLQGILKALGVLAGRVTGTWTRETHDAVVAVQRWLGHAPTGEPTPALKRDLHDLHTGKKAPPPAAPSAPAPAAGSAAAPGAVSAPGAPSATGSAPAPAPAPAPAAAALGAPKVSVKDAVPEVPALCSARAKKKDDKKPAPTPIAAGILQVLGVGRKGTCPLCEAHDDCLDNDHNFIMEVARMAERLGGDAANFMAIMHFESAHTFTTDIRNKKSGATGLIQFMPSTAKGMETSTSDLAKMCRLKQLEYVERYFREQKKAHRNADFRKLSHVVLAVFEPVGLDPGHEVLGVAESKCEGKSPFLETRKGDVPITKELRDYYDKHGEGVEDDGGVLKDKKGKVIGVHISRASYWIEHDGKPLKVTPHLRAVYAGNSGLDRNGTGFLLREDYAQLLEKDIVPKCGKASCEKATELQESVRKGNAEYVIQKRS